MNKTNLENIQSGAVLAADVSADSGHILLRAGTRLTSRHVRLLQSRGIDTVHIGEPKASVQHKPAMEPGAVDSIVQARFRKVDTRQALIAELVKLCRDRLVTP